MKSRHAFLGSITVALGLLVLPVAARAQEDDTLPRPHDTRRDPFRNPMTPKPPDPIGDPPQPQPPKPPIDLGVTPAAKDPQPDPRAALLREFSAKHIRVSGVIYHMVPETVHIPAGVDLFGATICGDVEVQSWRSCSTAVVENPKFSRLLSAGDQFEDGLTVKRIERAAVVFLFRDIEVRVPLGEGDL